MWSKRFLPNYAKTTGAGFSLLELLVAMTIGLVGLGICSSSVLSARNAYRLDVIRTRINQDLRGALDIIGANVRVAGENLGRAFPALEITAGANSELFLRRNLVDEVLKLCEALVASSANQDVVFANGVGAGCMYADNTHNYESWRTYRLAEGEPVPVFIYNSATKQGEFFTYSAEDDTGSTYSIRRSGGLWQYDYDTTATAIYILEQWRFRVVDDVLELLINNETDPLRVTFGISEFQAQAVMQDDSVLDTLDRDQDWTLLKGIRLQLSGFETFRNRTISRSLDAQFFPRNVLSN